MISFRSSIYGLVCLLAIMTIVTFDGVGLSAYKVAAQQEVEELKGLTLSPIRTEIILKPGSAFTNELKITNSTETPMTVDMSVEEFKVTGEQYDYEFFAESDIARWVTFKPSEINLKAGETKNIKYTIGVPLTAETRGYYISMFASTSVSSSDGRGNSQQRVASLLYVTVSSDVLGATTMAGHVLSLSSPWFIVDKGVWGATVQNTGNTHYRSEHSIVVQDLFGNTVGEYRNSVLILPNTVRSISGDLPIISIPGIYKATYDIGLGDSTSVPETRYMLFLPFWAVITVLVLITLSSYRLLRYKNRRRH